MLKYSELLLKLSTQFQLIKLNIDSSKYCMRIDIYICNSVYLWKRTPVCHAQAQARARARAEHVCLQKT